MEGLARDLRVLLAEWVLAADARGCALAQLRRVSRAYKEAVHTFLQRLSPLSRAPFPCPDWKQIPQTVRVQLGILLRFKQKAEADVKRLSQLQRWRAQSECEQVVELACRQMTALVEVHREPVRRRRAQVAELAETEGNIRMLSALLEAAQAKRRRLSKELGRE
jgi:hypothetical protein